MQSQKTEERVETPYLPVCPECGCEHVRAEAPDWTDHGITACMTCDRCDHHWEAAFAVQHVTVPREALYVECCQCDHCQHTGINDSPDDKAACNSCDWRGPSPEEDRCPGCGDTGTMARACPECGGHYRCVAEGHLAADFPHDPVRTP